YTVHKKCNEILNICSPSVSKTTVPATAPVLLQPQTAIQAQPLDQGPLLSTKAVALATIDAKKNLQESNKKLSKFFRFLADKFPGKGVIYDYLISLSDWFATGRNIVNVVDGVPVFATSVIPVLRVIQGLLFVLQGFAWLVDGMNDTNVSASCKDLKGAVDNVLGSLGAAESIAEGGLWIAIGVLTATGSAVVAASLVGILFNIVFPISFGIMIIQGTIRLAQTVQFRMRMHTFLNGIAKETDSVKKAQRIRDFFKGELTITEMEERAIRYEVKQLNLLLEVHKEHPWMNMNQFSEDKSCAKQRVLDLKEMQLVNQKIEEKIQRKILRLKACTSGEFVDLLMKVFIEENPEMNAIANDAKKLQTLVDMAYQANAKGIGKASAKILIGIAGIIGSIISNFTVVGDIVLWSILNLCFFAFLDCAKTTDPLFVWKFTNKERMALGLDFDPSIPFRVEAIRVLREKDKEYAEWCRDKINAIIDETIKSNALPNLKVKKDLKSKVELIFEQLPGKVQHSLYVTHVCEKMDVFPTIAAKGFPIPLKELWHWSVYTSAKSKKPVEGLVVVQPTVVLSASTPEAIPLLSPTPPPSPSLIPTKGSPIPLSLLS
ncbi:MAG: hypothetical protein WCP39_02800, partial [Chlamydiota bacterium]